jgi:hypothetical protein
VHRELKSERPNKTKNDRPDDSFQTRAIALMIFFKQDGAP